MKKVLIGLFACVSLNASAGIMDEAKIKKAVKETNSRLTTELAKVKEACGNKQLEFSVNWNQWKSYKLDAEKHETTIGYVGSLIINDIFKGMINACEDIDYKAAISKTKKIEITGQNDFSKKYTEFKKTGNILQVTVNGDGYSSKKNKENFKLAW